MTPREQYHHDIKQRQFCSDPLQLEALDRIEDLYQRIITTPPYTPGLFDRLLKRAPEPVRGLYLWGGVGRGKTYLMDLFFNALPFKEKQRLHFHRFMQQIHAELQALPKSPDPLLIVAKSLAQQMRVLCLDELHVHDIGDAMLLGRLLEALFNNGVILVTTSNIPADQLYKNGLQRERFLPAIEQLKRHTESFYLDGRIDYRTQLLEKAGVYHLSDSDGSDAALKEYFLALAPEPNFNSSGLQINNRTIATRAESDDVVWFSFKELCETARSAADYIEISRLYHTVIISDIPAMTEAVDDAAQRFIHLIDALYDHNVNIIISAAVPINQLYHGRRHQFAFQRTISRLQEMGSRRYHNQPHRS
jgi:cell division protein ZapE